jgi:C4-dicarboxylate-specific signal transduction histidine kinase
MLLAARPEHDREREQLVEIGKSVQQIAALSTALVSFSRRSGNGTGSLDLAELIRQEQQRQAV